MVLINEHLDVKLSENHSGKVLAVAWLPAALRPPLPENQCWSVAVVFNVQTAHFSVFTGFSHIIHLFWRGVPLQGLTTVIPVVL